MDNRRNTKQKIVTIAIIIVAVLLFISILLLSLLSQRQSGSSSSSGNVIEGGKSEIIRLKGVDDTETVRLNVSNMFPGDSETGIYCVQILDSGVKALNFSVNFESQNTALAKVFIVKVVVDEGEEPLYCGPLSDMPESVRAVVKGEEVTFTVTVTLDTSAGNECQSSKITMDFLWWVSDADYEENNGSGGAGIKEKCCPWCFGACPWCWILMIAVLKALYTRILARVVVVAWLIFREKKKHDAWIKGITLVTEETEIPAMFYAMRKGISSVAGRIFKGKNKGDK